jgi:hypothetical protein
VNGLLPKFKQRNAPKLFVGDNRTGHGSFKNHLNRMDAPDSPEEVMAFHFLCESPALSLPRTRTFGLPILNERQYKEITIAQVQGFATLKFAVEV